MEVESILLAMQNALKYYNSTAVKKRHEALFILSDCQAAIDTVIRPFSHFVHPSVDTIRTLLRQLQDMSITVSLTWIPGHMGIEYNEKANQLAKSAHGSATRSSD